MDDVSAKLDRLSDQIQKISEASSEADAKLQNNIDIAQKKSDQQDEEIEKRSKRINRHMEQMQLLFGIFVGLVSILSFVLAITWFLFTIKNDIQYRYPPEAKQEAQKSDMYKIAESLISF